MNSSTPQMKLSEALTDTPANSATAIPRIIRAHFPPEHLISRDEIQKCHNKIQFDRSLLDTEKHRLQGHLEHVQQYGLMMDQAVPEEEVTAWEWVRPYLRKEEGE